MSQLKITEMFQRKKTVVNIFCARRSLILCIGLVILCIGLGNSCKMGTTGLGVDIIVS